VHSCAKLLGEKLRAWRRRKKLPLKAVAGELGVSVSVISEWERGIRFPSSRHLDALSEYTGIPACFLFCPHEIPIENCPVCPELRGE